MLLPSLDETNYLRFEDSRRRALWDRAFQVGSLVAVFAQGIVLGAFIQGFQVVGRRFSGTSVDFLTPFSILTGLALLFGYGLLGAGWLIIKTEGALREWARRQGRLCLIGVVIGIVIVSLWTPFMEPRIAERWFSMGHILFLWPVPIATLAVVVWWRALSGPRDAAPFAAAVLLFLLSYLGIAISLWPMIVPYNFTLWQAASPPSTQAFLLVGALFPATGDPDVLGLVVLGIPREGPAGHRLPLRSIVCAPSRAIKHPREQKGEMS